MNTPPTEARKPDAYAHLPWGIRRLVDPERRRRTKRRMVKRFQQWKRLVVPPRIANMTFSQRVSFARKTALIHRQVKCKHQHEHVDSFVDAFMALPPEVEGCIVEAGCFQGGSAAKFSLAAKLAGRRVVLFDSFEGLPENKEGHAKSILGHSIDGWFGGGRFSGSLEAVKHNIATYGHLDVCSFVEGWFEDSMPGFSEKACAIYLDVDLASSTRTCIKYLYPLLVPGGILMSQDGDFPLVIEVFDDDEFWKTEVGCAKPHIEGLGRDKMIRIVKPADAR